MKPTALITGASSPLGLSLIEKLKDVYNLILIYNENLEPLKKYVDNHRVIHCDFTKEDEILNLIKEINEMGVNISLLINMAALTKDSLKEDINMPDFTDSYKVNVYAPLKLIISLPLNSSVILNISSTDGIDTFNEYGIVYSLTKSSMIHLTKILSSISEKFMPLPLTTSIQKL